MGVSLLGLIKTLFFPWDKTFKKVKLQSVDTHCTPLLFAQSMNCMPPYMLLPNLTPTVNAIATRGTLFATTDASTTLSSPLMIWYRVLDDTARKNPDREPKQIKQIRW